MEHRLLQNTFNTTIWQLPRPGHLMPQAPCKCLVWPSWLAAQGASFAGTQFSIALMMAQLGCAVLQNK